MVTYAPRPANEPNPWAEDTWNLTGQGRFITQFGMARAAQRASEAGTKIGAPRKKAPDRPIVMTIVQKRFFLPAPQPTPVTIGFGENDIMGPSEPFQLAVATEAAVFPGSMQSEAFCDTAPMSDASFDLRLPDGTTIANVMFLAGQHIGSVIWLFAATIVNAGDVLTLIAPAESDPTLAGVNLAFVGQTVVRAGP